MSRPIPVRHLKTALRIAALTAFAFAAISPATYALLSAFVGDRSAFIDMAVVGSCIILVADAFKHLAVWLFVFGVAVLLTASLAGMFVHFQDSGESGPLPYEWLNGYYLRSMPLLLISAGARLLLRREHQRA